jgi:glutamate-ammonia-ligase adenylyltransferase
VPHLALPTLDTLEHPNGCAGRLRAALARGPDPEGAAHRAEDVLSALARADAARLGDLCGQRTDAVVRVLAALCGAAPFLAPLLVAHPDWLYRLAAEDFATARTPSDYDETVRRAIRERPADDCRAVLRQVKYYELARITVRELSPDLVPPERSTDTLHELSHLADALLAQALRAAGRVIEEACGPPQWEGSNGESRTFGFIVFGLGKLGSEELNYSSDVDLIYVLGGPDDTPVDAWTRSGGPSGLSPVEYFTRLAQDFGRLVSETTGDGFLYRIDLDLRPEGGSGALVVPAPSLIDYYESWAATWEKAAFMKARPVAGDIERGWRVIRAIDPMVYRSSTDYDGVTAMKELKGKVERARDRPGAAFDVKVGRSGIRDIESIAQSSQLLHGGRIPQVRGRSTEGALVALAEVGILSAVDASDLLAAYRFLRRTENRLQMIAERQTHRLPTSDDGLERIARALGFDDPDPTAAFTQSLEMHRARTRRVFDGLFEDSAGEQIVALFARDVPRLLASHATRPLIEDLAAQFYREISVSTDPPRALNNLDRFIRGVGSRHFYYELLLDRPELVSRLVKLFAASEYLSNYFATHPRLIEPIFSDPNVLLHSPAELEHNLATVRAGLPRQDDRDDVELDFETLRLFHHREVLNVGLLDLAEKITRADVEGALTDIAEASLRFGLSVARRQASRAGAPTTTPSAVTAGDFLVVGMGKLASRELTYGSDLDVIFLYDVPGAEELTILEAQEYFVRLAQKLISTLRTRTAVGICYDIDARLRPSGNQGMLVVSLASFERYHATSAQVWERQALLRARPVAGSDRLGVAFDRLRRQILAAPLPADLAREIHRIRERAEVELGQETDSRHDFKAGRGGMHDIETLVQFLQLRSGATHDTLFDVETITTQLAHLRELGLLDAGDEKTLREGWEFLQGLSRRLRIVENRSISDLDEERGDLDAVARGLGYPTGQRQGGARRALLEDYRRHTATIRSVYGRVLGVTA